MLTTAWMRGLTAIGLGLVLGVSGCRSERPERGEPVRGDETEASAKVVETSKQPVRRFDPQGNLLPSDDYVAGVRLPRGCEIFRDEELQHVYRIRAPIDRVLAYFGPMMITGNVERRGKGAVYKRASVRGAEVNPTKVDVAILEVGSNLTRISITELPPPPEHAPSPDQTRAAARDAFRMLD